MAQRKPQIQKSSPIIWSFLFFDVLLHSLTRYFKQPLKYIYHYETENICDFPLRLLPYQQLR